MSAAPSALRVALDLRNPFAYLALEPTLELFARFGLAPDCLPFAGPTLRPPEPARPDDDRGTRHRRYRAEHLARELEVYAEALGLAIREPYRDAPADAADRAWLWLHARAPERLPGFLRELFGAYWALGLDACDAEAVAARLGPDAAAFRDWERREGGAALAESRRALGEAGVFQTPAYLLEGELFLGRQHLPMLRWMLEGRRGSVPM